jgi:predicted nuclease of predicted toxin-antitoxin system
MKILLDENVPHRLRHFLPGHDVFTVTFMGWESYANGSLLRMAGENGFDVLLTKDTGVPF